MSNRKLAIVVSAMMLSFHLGNAIAAEPSLDQLAEIQSILSDNDIRALRSFIERHPELMEGDTPLAVLLRRFLDESEGLTSFLGYAPDLRDAVAPPTQAPPVDEGSDSGEEPDGGGGDPGEDPDDGGGDPGENPDGGGSDPGGEPLY